MKGKVPTKSKLCKKSGKLTQRLSSGAGGQVLQEGAQPPLSPASPRPKSSVDLVAKEVLAIDSLKKKLE